MSKLLPCPFCGSEDISPAVYCRHCGANIRSAVKGEKRKRWNTRTSEEWTEDDEPLPEDGAIKAAHPLKTDKHETYVEALRMVSAKRSKYALVDLVNWLLVKGESADVIGKLEEVLPDEIAFCKERSATGLGRDYWKGRLGGAERVRELIKQFKGDK